MRPTMTLTAFDWNLVTKNLHGHEMLRKQIHEKASKLEKHLKHFPPDTVHLQIALGRQPKRRLRCLHTAALNLRVPSNILHSEKSSTDVITAFDDAVDALLREVESLKARLRRERLNSKIITPPWAYPGTPARRRSKRPSASCRTSTIRTSRCSCRST